MKNLLMLVVGIFLISVVPLQADTPAIDFTDWNNGNMNSLWSLGFEFKVSESVTVGALGVLDVWDNVSKFPGFAKDQQVGLWKSDGTLLASVFVTNSDPSTGGGAHYSGGTAIGWVTWRFHAITPVTLSPGTNYIVASQGGEGMVYKPVSPVWNSKVTFISNRVGDVGTNSNNPFVFPNRTENYNGIGYFGGNFMIADSITPPATQATITASPTTVKPGDAITVTFSGAPGNNTDWIGIYKVGASDQDFIEAYYLEGYKSGTLTFLKAPAEAGNYNFRMFPNDQSEPRLAVSNIVTIATDAVIPPAGGGDFSDNFEDGNMDGWVIVDEPNELMGDKTPSDWRVINGPINGKAVYQGTNRYGDPNVVSYGHLGTFLIYDRAEWKDFIFEFDTLPNDNDGLGFVWRWKDRLNHYRYMMVADTAFEKPYSEISKRLGPNGDKHPYYGSLATSNELYTQGKLIHLKVEVVGTKMTVYKDGKVVLTAQDATYDKGKIGFALGAESGVYFDNVKVTDLGGGTQPPPSSSSDMVLYLPFDEGSGASAKDMSNYGNNGTIKGKVEWDQGIKGSALKFSKDWKGYVEVPDSSSLDVSQQVTISAWIKPSKIYLGTAWENRDTLAGKYRTYYLDIAEDGKLAFTQYNVKPDVVTGKSAMTNFLNTWVHIAATYDGKEYKIYINDKLDNSIKATGNIAVTSYPFTVGWVDTNRYFDGLIDEVKIWSRALTEAEVVTLASETGGTGTQPPPSSGDLVLIGTDPNEDPAIPNIKEVFVRSDADKIYFKVTSYVNWANDIIFNLFLDEDQNPKTGTPWFATTGSIGYDRNIAVYLVGGAKNAIIYTQKPGTTQIVDIYVADSILTPNSNVIEFSINRKDIGNPKIIDFIAHMDFDFKYRDDAPDTGYYTYKLDGTSNGGGTQPTGDLVLYLPFDEGNGASAKDMSSYGNNGTIKGKVEWDQGIKGSALNFSKDWKGHVEIPDSNSLDVSQQITISAWIKPSKIYIGNDHLQRSSIVNKWWSYYLDISQSGKLSLFMYGVKPEVWFSGNTDMKKFLNTWVHVAAVYDGQEQRLYINGKLEASAKASGTISVRDYALTVGWSIDSSRYFDGLIDEVKTWSRALTEAELANIASTVTPTPAGCDAPISIKGPSEKDFVLMGTDPDDLQEVNLNQVFVKSDASKIYFQVTTHKNAIDNFNIAVDMDTDQNKKTGYLGMDYSVNFGVENGNLFHILWAWDKNKGDWVETTADVSYVTPPLPNNVFFFSLNLKDINNPKFIDLCALIDTKKSGEWVVIDYAPDNYSNDYYCYYRYNLGETPIVSGGRTLSIPEVTGAPGQDVTVPINISDATGVTGADINVLYDSNILTAKDPKTTTMSSALNLASNLNTPGKIILRLAGTNAIAGGSGALIDMIFTIKANATTGTETPVKFESAEVFDANAQSIVMGTQDGKVKIGPACMKGDVNNDGSIKSNDAILTLRISAGLMTPTDQQFCAADYNSDKQVKSNDAIIILRKSAGLIAPGKEIIATSRNITLTLGEAYSTTDKSVTVPLRVDNPEILAGGDICVAYDNSVLQAVNVSFGDSVLKAFNFAEPGIVRIAFAGADRFNSEIVARIEFNVLKRDVFNLAFQSVQLYGPDAIPLVSRGIENRLTSYILSPKYSALLQNYPNPFNPETWIPYQLKEDSIVTVKIHSVKGELIREIRLGYKSAGLYMTQSRTAYWDGKNEAGEYVSSGVYFYTIQTDNFSATKKMIISR